MIIYLSTQIQKLFLEVIKGRLELTAMKIARRIARMKKVGNITTKIVITKKKCGTKMAQ